MASINLGVLNFGTKIDLAGFKAGIQKVQAEITGMAAKIPGIGPALQAAARVGTVALSGLNRALSAVKSAVTSLVGAFGPLLALLAPAALVGFVFKSVGAFTQAEAAATRLESTLKSLTGATDEQIAALEQQAIALQKVTTFEDDAITSAQGTLAAFGANTDQILELTPIVLDAATAFAKMGSEGGNLESVSFAVGKALGGNTTALARLGIQLDDATKKQIENGTQAERATIIYGELAKFQGAAEAQALTFWGRLTQLKNVFGDVQEAVGEFTLKLVDLGGTSTTIIEKLDSMRKSILAATKTEEFAQLVTVVKQLFGAFGEVFSAGVDLVKSLFGVEKQSDQTAGALFAMRKVAEVVVVSAKAISLALTLVKQFLLLLKAGWDSAWALMTATISNAAIRIIQHMERILTAGAALADVFGAKLPGPIEQFRATLANLRSDIANNAIGAIDKATASSENLGRAMLDTEGRFVGLIGSVRQLTGDAEVVGTKVRDFAAETRGTGRAARDASESIDDLAGSTDKAGKESKEAKEEMAGLTAIMEAGKKAAEAFRSGIETARAAITSSAQGIKDEIAALEARNKTMMAANEMARIQAEREEELLQISNRRRDSIAEEMKRIDEITAREADLEGAIELAALSGVNQTAVSAVGPNGPQIPKAGVDPALVAQNQANIAELKRLQAERADLTAKAGANIVAIEQLTAAAVLNVYAKSNAEISAGLRKNDEERAKAEEERIKEFAESAKQQLEFRIKGIEEAKELDLRALELELRTRIANGENRLVVEADIQNRRVLIVQDAERRIQDLNQQTGRINEDLIKRERDLEFETQNEILASRERNAALIAKQSEDRIAAIKSVVDTELFEIQDGQIRIRDILQGTQDRILDSIVKSANASFEAWLTGQNAMVGASQDAAGSIQGIFGNLGGSLGGIFQGISSAFGGLFGGKGVPGIAGGSAGGGLGFLGSLGGFLANPLVGIGASLLGGLFGKKKSGPVWTGPTIEGIRAGSSAIFNENSSRAASTAQGLARDSSVKNIIQQISFPVSIRVETQESDRIAEEIEESFRQKVKPEIDSIFENRDRIAQLLNYGTPRRQSFA